MKRTGASDDVDEQRLTMLSVLQELTVAALDLFDPSKPIDEFLERLASRLLARTALCIEEVGDAVGVIGSAGLSRQSRALSLPEKPSNGHDWNSATFAYPEVSGANVMRWTFDLEPDPSSASRWTLVLFFDVDLPLEPHYRGMVARLSCYLHTALTHRQMRVREQLARAAAEQARERSEFLSDASRVLSGSLEGRFSASAAARLAVPRFGDWCTIDVFHRDRSTRRLGAVHTSPASAALVEALELVTPDPECDEGVPRVQRTGRTEIYTDIHDEDLRPEAVRCPPLGTRDPRQLELVRKLGMGSYVVLPLIARGSTLGALACGVAPPGRNYDRDEIELAEELARRISLWLDNAHLVEDLRASLAWISTPPSLPNI